MTGRGAASGDTTHMPDNTLAEAVETFSAPIEGVIVALGKGIAEAQKALDLNSIQTQEQIDSDPALSRQGLQATWYQFPRVDLQLKLSLSIVEDRPATATGSSVAATAAAAIPVTAALNRRLIAQPVSASYRITSTTTRRPRA